MKRKKKSIFEMQVDKLIGKGWSESQARVLAVERVSNIARRKKR